MALIPRGRARQRVPFQASRDDVLTVRVSLLPVLAPQQRDALHRRLEGFTKDLVDEIERLELEARATEAQCPEVTTAMIDDADLVVRRRPRPRKLSRGDVGIKAALAISQIGIGGMFGLLHSTWQGILFGLFMASGSILWVLDLRRAS